MDINILCCDALLLEGTGYIVWIDLLYFGYCTLIYQGVDLLYSGHYLPLDIACGSTRVDLLHFGHCPYFGVDSIVVQTL